MFTTCLAVAYAWSHAHNACADAAPDSALRDPPRDVTPSGTPHCKNACSNVNGEGRKARSNQAECTPGPKNLPAPKHCAGPRAATLRQLTPLVAGAHALDVAWTVRVGVACRSRSRDTAGSPATAARSEPPGHTLHCNSAFLDAAARTAAAAAPLRNVKKCISRK